MKERNIGWRLDLILASRVIADQTVSCVVQREFGASDHGPVIAVFEDGPNEGSSTPNEHR
jgi:exonuclease III